MEYAVFKSGGKQYKVSLGDVVEVEKLEVKEGDELSLDSVLFYALDNIYKIGTPVLSDVKLTGKVLAQIKGKKIRVSKFKSKVRYRRVGGHRQLLTKIKIEKIVSDKEEKTVKEKKETTPKKAEKSKKKV